VKTQTGLLIATAIACTFSISPSAFAKTAKDCTGEWRADKAGMQARGVTERAYVEQCKGGAEPTAVAPAAKPAEAAPASSPRQTTATGSKTAKECTAEWRADKAGMQARGVTERAYVEQCKGGAAPTASAPAPQPTAATPPAPAAPRTPTSMSSSKTAKECVAEWRAETKCDAVSAVLSAGRQRIRSTRKRITRQ
jgi:predicted secreted protein